MTQNVNVAANSIFALFDLNECLHSFIPGIYQRKAMILFYPAIPNKYQYPSIAVSYDVITKPALSKMAYVFEFLVLGKNYVFILLL